MQSQPQRLHQGETYFTTCKKQTSEQTKAHSYGHSTIQIVGDTKNKKIHVAIHSQAHVKFGLGKKAGSNGCSFSTLLYPRDHCGQSLHVLNTFYGQSA